ncbi:hypothetical protein [Nonomuraea rhizosphaerae]|uniref:hypothetical protein n=1 Tax=Nonomuraea rhizosphaerae TaxID=2665663 RepID=UPI001C5DE49A|nr:hypothetical protein [Nonomuraea rhizosphaerae]
MSESPTSGKSAQELLQMEAQQFRARRRTYGNGAIADTAWNGWRLQPDKLLLTLCDSTGHDLYDLQIQQFTSSSRILDFLVHVSKRGWPGIDTGQATIGLLKAIDDILRLQTNVCAGGANQQLQDAQVSELINAYVQRFNSA